ncbi:ABC transporter substrate-binding protein [Methylomarinum sp. Ch1-1]|uniref:ABC transporter substrate-binding protein n=1 Tax=Methylomarinum roseum TaxID=3067653 RepID=A0AAU7NZG6_9GAMM|nr:ABC transporter substrate-binding protein [Methylomarinum sp. Ch1-1]MDP4521479.1 ABC transporter substrate-binding protein [Methylomarinum sp. Ch1-1]
MLNNQTLSFVFFIFTLLSASTYAAEDNAQAQRVIENSSNQIKQTLQQPAYQHDFNKATQFVDGVVTEFVDMPRISLLVLGKNIRKSTVEQRRRFIKEFKTLLVRTYTRAFLEYQDWSITFVPYHDNKSDRKTLVKSLIHQPGKQPIDASYRMVLSKNGEWKVYDIIIGGVSLVTTYRTSFNQKIAQSGSLESVIQDLVEKNSKATPEKEI